MSQSASGVIPARRAKASERPWRRTLQTSSSPNFMMLELIMTRQDDTDMAIVRRAKGLHFLVLDELHT